MRERMLGAYYEHSGPLPQPERILVYEFAVSPDEVQARSRTRGATPGVIEGQFISINQGNRTARTVIGLGAGASEVQTQVQVYETRRNERLERVAEFTTNARSGYKPGMAETMGAGAAAGNLAAAAAVSAAGSVASEMLSANVEADAERTATDVAAQLQSYFAQQGWISSP